MSITRRDIDRLVASTYGVDISKKSKGWKSESARHSLARKGIKTGRKSKTVQVLAAQTGPNANLKKEKYKTKDPNADFINTMIAYENDKLSPAQETKFLKQVKKKGLAGKLQGHYGREIARRGI